MSIDENPSSPQSAINVTTKKKMNPQAKAFCFIKIRFVPYRLLLRWVTDKKKVWKRLESGRRPDSDGVDKLRPRVREKVGRFGWMPAKITDAVPEYKSEGHPAAFRRHDVGLFRCDAADFRFFGLSLKRFGL